MENKRMFQLERSEFNSLFLPVLFFLFFFLTGEAFRSHVIRKKHLRPRLKKKKKEMVKSYGKSDFAKHRKSF